MILAVFGEREIVDADLIDGARSGELDRIVGLVEQKSFEVIALAFRVVDGAELEIDGGVFNRALDRPFEIRKTADQLGR